MTRTIEASETADPGPAVPVRPDHLDFLGAHPVLVRRPVAAGCERPMLLRVAEQACRPGRFPVPVMPAGTAPNPDQVREFPDKRVSERDEGLIVASVEDSIDHGRMPDPGARTWGQHSTTRRDEDMARVKERILSWGDSFGQWDPRNQQMPILAAAPG